MKKHPWFYRVALAAVWISVLSIEAQPHHGFGRFDASRVVHYEGTITSMDFVNPHSYLHFDRVDESGNVISMRCEMRAASLLQRSGWSAEMFEVGLTISVEANPHRDDPSACYAENITIGDSPTINRNQQFAIAGAVDSSNRPATLANGVPNISDDWAVEQLVLTVPPDGGRGDLVPKRFVEAYANGTITMREIRAQNPPQSRPVYTARGRAEADAFEMWNPEHNPRLRCLPTSIIYDWTFDWPINRIVQTGEEIVIDYGLYANRRIIHMDMTSHPADITPSNTGYSIGHWEGDTLVVETVGFTSGVLSPPTPNSDQMHVVERFTLDAENMTLTREYTVTDPVYLAEPWVASDTVYPSDVPFEAHECLELTPEFID